MRTILSCVTFNLFISSLEGYLYPLESETRQVKNLNGLWLFAYGNKGFSEKWYETDLKLLKGYDYMPVPGSFNEIIPTRPELRDYLGWVWYQRDFYLGKKWGGSKIFVYFGAVDHHAVIWCNAIHVGNHSGGHIPFHVEVTSAIKWDERNLLIVAVNNTLTPTTIPQGYVSHPNYTSRYPPGTSLYSHNFDYFDYSGINRNVFLYSVPHVFIQDLDIIADSLPENRLSYEVSVNKDASSKNCSVVLSNMQNDVLASHEGCKGSFSVKSSSWYPSFGRALNLEVTMQSEGIKDIYRSIVGFRTIQWDGKVGLRINGEKVYLRGFGMHEDAAIRGRGYDDVTAARDLGLLSWTGANAIRTSHYPYSEEFLIQCDIRGIAVILEVPACSLDGFSNELYKEHERITLEIITKYKHHPSIIMWSLANEPVSDNNASTAYFSRLYEAAKSVDSTRPITFVTSRSPESDKAIGNMDIILLNRYSGWYQDGGRLDLIDYQIKHEITRWYTKYKKPIIITEYGAGAIPGQREFLPAQWTEGYQADLLTMHFKAFDQLREKGILNGEMIWNLIDFKTPQEYFRPGYCMKGVFTRDREPKLAAYTVKQRYQSPLLWH